jgi:hypothetical protein
LDRAEGALRVAEKALAEIQALKAKIARLEAAPLGAVSALVADEVRSAVATLPAAERGADGIGLAGALIDREGELIVTLTNGETKSLGRVVGRKGRNGRDGFGFDDMDVCVLDDDRTIELSFRRGEDEKAFTLKWPTVIDRGPFKIDRRLPYESGDGVTWGGQFYICNEQTNDKPDLSKDGKPWRLAVRKGRDGKDAKKE